MTTDARLGRRQRQHRCSSIFVFSSVIVVVVVAEISRRSAKNVMGCCGARTPGLTGSENARSAEIAYYELVVKREPGVVLRALLSSGM